MGPGAQAPAIMQSHELLKEVLKKTSEKLISGEMKM